jgi:hypothetical protein
MAGSLVGSDAIRKAHAGMSAAVAQVVDARLTPGGQRMIDAPLPPLAPGGAADPLSLLAPG